MISSKELKYVGQNASKVPMPGVEYSLGVLKEMKRCYELFNEKYKGKEYSMLFSNAQELDFEILSKNLCHMLGVDFNILKGDSYANFRSEALKTNTNDMNSYSLLELILENMESVAMYDNDPNNCLRALNYYKSGIKCEILNKMSNFDKCNFAAINCKGEAPDVDYNLQKMLFVPSNQENTPYYLMIITKEDGLDKYVVKSLLAPKNPITFFANQEVIIPTQIIINDGVKFQKNIATAEEKLALITMYMNIISKYKLSNKLNIFADYESLLNDLTKVKTLKR